MNITVSNPGTLHIGGGPNKTMCGNIKNRPTTEKYIIEARDYIFCEKCFPNSAAIQRAKESIK